MARKNGNDPAEHLVELMEEQLAVTKLHSEQFEALRVEMGTGFRDVRDEIRSFGDRLTHVVDKTAPLVSLRPTVGRIVLFGWSEGVWHPAAVVAVREDAVLDLEVFGVSADDDRRIVRGVPAGDVAGHWRWPDLH